MYKKIIKTKAMGNKTKASASASPSYVEFEPYCEWQKTEEVETLIVHLPNFRKDQLKVQVTNLGVLQISGEKPIDKTRIRRFVKEAKVPQGCNINDIHAKIKNGCLHVIMPKKVPNAPQVQEQPAPKEVAISEDTQKAKVDNPVLDRPKENVFKIGISVEWVGVGFGIAFAVMGIIAGYVACKWSNQG